MPTKRVYRKKTVKRVKKTNYKKKKFNVKQHSMVSLGQGFPMKMLMTHRYVELLSMTSTVGSLATYSWAANGMYDPNLSSSGHQPLYFDNMTALYNHFHVIGSKITVKVANSTSATGGGRIGVYQNDDTTITPSYIDAMRERNPQSSKMIGPGQDHASVFTLKYSSKKNFGGATLSNNALRGNVSNNPTELSVFTLFYQPNDLTSTTTIYFEVCIEYIAVWTELKELASS